MPGSFYLEGKIQKLSLENLMDRLEELETKIDAIKTQTDKLAGELPISGSITADWQTAESDVLSIGGTGIRQKVHSLMVSINNLVGTVVTIRMYTPIGGVERRIYTQTFDATVEPPGLWIVNGTLAIHAGLRLTLQSNNAADNGQGVDYDCLVETM